LPEPGLSRPADPDDEPVIDVRDLRMRYGKTDVLNGVSFTARRGEVLVLLGPNGAFVIAAGSGALGYFSGIFYPITHQPAFLQWVGQAFPLCWLGLGLRSALLPGNLAVVEIGHSWRHLETAGVLGAWAVAGLIAAPILLRRAARREAGSKVAAARDRFMTRGRL
jgi:ABC-2 type transport system permease protein